MYTGRSRLNICYDDTKCCSYSRVSFSKLWASSGHRPKNKLILNQQVVLDFIKLYTRSLHSKCTDILVFSYSEKRKKMVLKITFRSSCISYYNSVIVMFNRIYFYFPSIHYACQNTWCEIIVFYSTSQKSPPLVRPTHMPSLSTGARATGMSKREFVRIIFLRQTILKFNMWNQPREFHCLTSNILYSRRIKKIIIKN